MATSLTSVKLPLNTWVDIYTETGITVGVQIIIQNLGDATARLSESASEPISTTGYNIIEESQYLTNVTSNVGAWGFSRKGTIIQVEEA